MYQIDNATAATTQPAPTPPGKPGYFTDGSAVGGVPATVVPAEWLNAVQQEIINAILDAGLTPDKTAFNQLSLAIKRALPGRLLAIRSLTGAGSYTPTTGTKYIHVRGGAGGGGGQASVASGSLGFGGGAGGYFEWFGPISALGSGPTYAFTVGASGAAGTASGQVGGSGGNTTFAGQMSALGGGGGGVGVGGYGMGGSATISVAGALLVISGREGQGSTSSAIGGTGGNAYAGPGGVPHTSNGGSGVAGGGGAGGGGTATSQAGGSGGAGYLIISEYTG
ncbi:hypothetical protein L2Y94_05785 [Luteibacter aegosomatis]|uniref:hypothetical protein n=1 Tax=Luteibacter aegosomatis TaxID=2911537 RepID=UPI001FFA2286|nr:hypothetical protein [Luteibacter aegosomatis]UPG86865.1 hypothetical protein L2Y94_05785 [Luteibacter aegosomatis]